MSYMCYSFGRRQRMRTVSAHFLFLLLLLFLVLSSPVARRHCHCQGLSSPHPSRASHPIGGVRARVVHDEAPVIVTIDDLLTDDEVSFARGLVSTDGGEEPPPTTDYQEDVFAPGADAEEDAHFRSVVERSGLSVPGEFEDSSPLHRFLWVVTNAAASDDPIDEGDVIRGANAIRRREAASRWRSGAGRALLDASADDAPFEAAGRRFVMPAALRAMLEERALSTVLGNELDLGGGRTAEISWRVRDATVVRYRGGESQVPHLDPCDATLLVCLADDCRGGDTCFPMIDRRITPKRGRAVLFFSSPEPPPLQARRGRKEWDEGEGEGEGGGDCRRPRREGEVLSLHHGGRVRDGEKIVAQLMFDATATVAAEAEAEVTNEEASSVASWLDLVSCLPSPS